MSLCDNCFKGVRHEGTPEGKLERINGVDSYIATPTGDYDKTKVVLFLTDVFGMQFINAQLLADDFARNGLKTVIIDYFKGDGWPVDAMDPGSTSFPNERRGAWFAAHPFDEVTTIIDNVIDGLKSEGVTRFGTTGYCYGGRFAFNFAFANKTHVSVTAHPSLLKVPEDLEKYLAESKAPLLINSCTIDEQFPPESQAKADEILGGGKFAPGYEREYWDGCTHGFAMRGDLSDPKVKAGREGAFEKSVAFFQKHL